MKATEVQALLDGMGATPRSIVLALRGVVLRTVPHAMESVVWSSLSYHRPEVGGRVKGAICQIVAKRGQVRLDFIHGKWLNDPDCLLQGNGVSKRYVVLDSVADAERPEIVAWIRQAAALDPKQFAESPGALNVQLGGET